MSAIFNNPNNNNNNDIYNLHHRMNTMNPLHVMTNNSTPRGNSGGNVIDITGRTYSDVGYNIGVPPRHNGITNQNYRRLSHHERFVGGFHGGNTGGFIPIPPQFGFIAPALPNLNAKPIIQRPHPPHSPPRKQLSLKESMFIKRHETHSNYLIFLKSISFYFYKETIEQIVFNVYNYL